MGNRFLQFVLDSWVVFYNPGILFRHELVQLAQGRLRDVFGQKICNLLGLLVLDVCLIMFAGQIGLGVIEISSRCFGISHRCFGNGFDFGNTFIKNVVKIFY